MNKQQRIEELKAQIKRLEESSKWDRVIEGEIYYYINDELDVRSEIERESTIDDVIYEIGNYCRDKDTLVNIAEEFSKYLKLLKWRDENDPELDLTDNATHKYFAYRDNYDNDFGISSHSFMRYPLIVYFSSEELCRQAYEEVLGVNIE